MATLLASDRLLTREQAADVLGVAPRTIRKHQATGQLSKVMVGGAARVLLSEVESTLTNGRLPGGARTEEAS